MSTPDLERSLHTCHAHLVDDGGASAFAVIDRDGTPLVVMGSFPRAFFTALVEFTKHRHAHQHGRLPSAALWRELRRPWRSDGYLTLVDGATLVVLGRHPAGAIGYGRLIRDQRSDFANMVRLLRGMRPPPGGHSGPGGESGSGPLGGQPAAYQVDAAPWHH